MTPPTSYAQFMTALLTMISAGAGPGQGFLWPFHRARGGGVAALPMTPGPVTSELNILSATLRAFGAPCEIGLALRANEAGDLVKLGALATEIPASTETRAAARTTCETFGASMILDGPASVVGVWRLTEPLDVTTPALQVVALGHLRRLAGAVGGTILGPAATITAVSVPLPIQTELANVAHLGDETYTIAELEAIEDAGGVQ